METTSSTVWCAHGGWERKGEALRTDLFMVPGWMENPGKSVAGVSLAIITRTNGGAEDASVGPASMDSMNVNGTGKRLTRRKSVVHHLSHGQSSGHIRLINIEPTGQ